MRFLLTLSILLGLTVTAFAAPTRVLIYTHNGKGYVHENIQASVDAMTLIAIHRGFHVDVSDDPAVFTPQNLKQYAALIFANTNNEAFATPAQREAFQHFIEAGGGFMGIHSASGSQRDWPYFAHVLGGKFLEHPVQQTLTVSLADPTSKLTAGLPQSFEWNDECYFFSDLSPDAHILLTVDRSKLKDLDKMKLAHPNDSPAQLPVAWYQSVDGGREFYMGLGHRPIPTKTPGSSNCWTRASHGSPASRNNHTSAASAGDTVFVMASALLTTDLSPLPLLARGKVRDIYAVTPGPASDLLFIASDRISAFDHVLGSGIPYKGRILTQLSLFWFDFLKDLVPNHLITADVADFPPALKPFTSQLEGRTMLVRRAQMFPVECVVRGYLSGSGWKDYQTNQAICGIPLPAGLRESDQLPAPIFTPAAKINTGGHDENISFATVIETIGADHANTLREISLAIYAKASAHAASKGVILADTKFEFGLIDGRITLADEVLTPDSSRYWPASEYAPGGPTPSFDKQYVRDYLESIHWNKQAPAPALPDEVVTNTREKYLQAFHLITGRDTL